MVWAVWTVVVSLGMDERHTGAYLPAARPDPSGGILGLFDGKTVFWGRPTKPPQGITPWVVRSGRGGPHVCVPGATLQEELLMESGKVLTVQSGRSPSSIAMRVVGEPPTYLPPDAAPPAPAPGDDPWQGSPMLPELPYDRQSFPTVSRRRRTVSYGVSIRSVLRLEIRHARRWLKADPALATVALLGAVSVASAHSAVHRSREAGYLNDQYWLKRAGWWRLAFLAGQGVGEVERYRARRLFRAGKSTHLRKVQRLVLGYMRSGGIPLGVEISLTAQALGTWLGIGRPDALVWMKESKTLVWIEVESRALKWASPSKQRKFHNLRTALREVAGTLGIDVEMCIQQVSSVYRETIEGRNRASKAFARMGAPPVPPPPEITPWPNPARSQEYFSHGGRRSPRNAPPEE
ncbi:MAG: hypothetical protein ACYCZN_01880 [Candidatus Dormibacteria bacterium]